MVRLFIALLTMGIFAPVAQAEVYTFIVKKQKEKEKKRWTLASWLDTRHRMRVMDLWLALNSPSPYEFYLGGEYQIGANKTNGFQGHFAAYASIFGLEAQWQNRPTSQVHGLFHLRIFGFHAQGTNITLQLGLRSRSIGDGVRNALAGVASSIYVMKYFGVDGYWRHYFDSAPNSTGSKFGGSRYEIGSFIDFSFVRIYARYYSESETISLSGSSTESTDTGTNVGLRLFF